MVLSIANYINKRRYSTASVVVKAPTLEAINQVLSLVLPVTLAPEMSHFKLSQMFARLVKNRTIWEYDNGTLVNVKPFYTQSSAVNAVGIPSNTSIIKRYIDTGKLYLNRYTFYSTKQS